MKTAGNIPAAHWPPSTGKGRRGKDAPTFCDTARATSCNAPSAARDEEARGTRRRPGPRTWLAVTIALLALALGAQPLYLHAKAALAQHLLQRAWHDGNGGQAAIAPWPWADTHPIARLRVPAHAIDQIVLAGDSGRVLAFGPGWAEASAAPGSSGTTVISAHRDTHFAFLRELAPGTSLALESGGAERRFRVLGTEVVDSRSTRIDTDAGDRLLLVTCWPFDAVDAGGPMRYVVTAVPDAAFASGEQ